MLTHTLEQIDTANEPAYLEATSSRSRAMSERHGFEVTGQFAFDDSPRCGRCGDLQLSEGESLPDLSATNAGKHMTYRPT